jgi:hypothetical protein
MKPSPSGFSLIAIPQLIPPRRDQPSVLVGRNLELLDRLLDRGLFVGLIS